jgi:beta-xylosidase
MVLRKHGKLIMKNPSIDDEEDFDRRLAELTDKKEEEDFETKLAELTDKKEEEDFETKLCQLSDKFDKTLELVKYLIRVLETPDVGRSSGRFLRRNRYNPKKPTIPKDEAVKTKKGGMARLRRRG